MPRVLKIGKSSWSIDWLRSVTESEAIEAHKNNKNISDTEVIRAWKAANLLSVPNNLKDQLKGLTQNRQARKKKKEDK